MIFGDIRDFLSWTLPGGIELLPIAIISLSFIWWATWRGTGFWSKQIFYKCLWMGSIGTIGLYIFLWIIFRPPPIPIRVILLGQQTGIAGQNPTGSIPDWRITGVIDQIERRLYASSDPVVVITPENSPVLAWAANSDSDIARCAVLMRVKWIFRVYMDSSNGAVHVSMKKYSGQEAFEAKETVVLSDKPFPAAVGMLVSKIVTVMKGDRETEWNVSIPNIPEELYKNLYNARHLYRSERVDSAVVILTDIINEHPQWKQAHQELATASLFVGLGKYSKETLDAILDAIDLDPKDALNYLQLGQYFLENRDWDEAESSFKLALNNTLDDARVYFFLSRLGFNRLQNLPWRTSKMLLERALQLDPGYEQARLALSRWYYDLYYYRYAKNTLNEGIAIDSHSVSLLLAYSVADLGLGDTKASMAHCEKILSFEPSNPKAWHNVGQILLRTHKYEEAIVAFDSSFANNGTTDNLYCTGLALERLERYEEALNFYQRRVSVAVDKDDRTARAARDQISKVKTKIRLRKRAKSDSLATPIQ